MQSNTYRWRPKVFTSNASVDDFNRCATAAAVNATRCFNLAKSCSNWRNHGLELQPSNAARAGSDGVCLTFRLAASDLFRTMCILLRRYILAWAQATAHRRIKVTASRRPFTIKYAHNQNDGRTTLFHVKPKQYCPVSLKANFTRISSSYMALSAGAAPRVCPAAKWLMGTVDAGNTALLSPLAAAWDNMETESQGAWEWEERKSPVVPLQSALWLIFRSIKKLNNVSLFAN